MAVDKNLKRELGIFNFVFGTESKIKQFRAVGRYITKCANILDFTYPVSAPVNLCLLGG